MQLPKLRDLVEAKSIVSEFENLLETNEKMRNYLLNYKDDIYSTAFIFKKWLNDGIKKKIIDKKFASLTLSDFKSESK